MSKPRPFGEYPRQVLDKSEEWSVRRLDNKTVTVLSRVEIMISEMDQNHFCGDTSRT